MRGMTKLIVVASLLTAVAVAPALVLKACAQPVAPAPAKTSTVCHPGTSC